MQKFSILAISLLQVALGVLGDGYYTVIGPGTVHSGHKYNVAVAVHNTVEPCQLKVGITGPSYNESKIIELNQAEEVKLVEFDVPELEMGTYNLTTEGVLGLSFYNTTRLNYNKFEPHVLIQTDKGVYKPGDEVKYRIIFLDENFRPAEIAKKAILWFEDSKRNRIKEIKNLDIIKGVYTGEFQLSEYAVLGTWRIFVQTKKNSVRKSVNFSVEKYVLPKYIVTVETNERVAVQDGDMQAIVRANYTYGKPVNGKVILLVQLQQNYWYDEEDKNLPKASSIIKTTDMVNGKAKFDFNVKEYEMRINKRYPSMLEVIATVEEQFTGVKLNATTSSTLFPYRYNMMCETYDTCSTYHANQEAEIVFKILHVDGTPLQDTKSIVRLSYVETYSNISWWRSENSTKPISQPPPENLQHFVFETHLNESSMAVFKVTLPDLMELEGYQHYFEATLEYAGQKDQIISTYPHREPKNLNPEDEDKEPKDFFKISVEYEKNKYSVSEGVDFTVTVNSSKPLNYYVYTIVGRGNILKMARVQLTEPQKVSTFKIVPTFEMAPYGRIYAHYVDEGNFYYDETTFYIDWNFQNKITISAPEEVKPGEDVALTIQTAPNSFVGLLGVDQSVLLLRSNNDVNEDQMRWRLGEYSTHTPHQGGYSSYPGDQSGLVTLTNAKYFYNWTKPEWYIGATFRSQFADNELTTTYMKSGVIPPLAASAAGSATPEAPRVRKDFSETWIFANIENTQSSNFTWIKKIPDSITSWVISGFSMNSEQGFATTKETTNIRTFQPFFVSVRLPYSVKRGEVISVPALVFNYLNKNLDVEVTLENTDGEFEFTEASNEILDVEKRSKMVHVPANSAEGVSFMLRPNVIGNVMLKFSAISALAGDAIHKSLKVVPEGTTEYNNRAFFINLKDDAQAKERFELQLPADIVPDSSHAEFAVVGDLLGPLLDNLDNFVRLPIGCGEQTMSTLVPNFLMLRYLQNTKKLNPTLEARIKRNLEYGYQNMLRFQHADGSFSSFGPGTKFDGSPRNGSTWLTAYVMRFLLQIGNFVVIDSKVTDAGIKYLAERQAANGSFLEKGDDFFYQLQRDELVRTATVCLALVEKQKTNADYDAALEKGLDFIAQNEHKQKDLNIKAMVAFTLHQANHTQAKSILAELQPLAKTDGDRRWWTTSETKEDVCCWWRWPRSQAVETTSYVLLTLLDQQAADSELVLQTVKWLVAQRNNYGGFSSTQDTAVGLQALTKFAEKSGYETANMHVDFKAEGGVRSTGETVSINEENALLMQTVELPAGTRAVEFQARGKGTALVQIAYQYNIREQEPATSFRLNIVINKNTPAHKLEFDACVEYVGEDGESNMAILEINMPSGYAADVESFEQLRSVERVRLIESKNDDTKIVIYFESLRKDENKCLLIEAYKTHAVAMQKPAAVVVYDYYDNSRKATAYYEVVSKICDICDMKEEKCQQVCS